MKLLNHHKGIQVRNGVTAEIDEAIVIEDHFRIFFNDYPITDMVAGSNQLKEHGAGFVITKGITRCVDKVKLDGDSILVYSDTGCDVLRSKRDTGPQEARAFSKRTEAYHRISVLLRRTCFLSPGRLRLESGTAPVQSIVRYCSARVSV